MSKYEEKLRGILQELLKAIIGILQEEIDTPVLLQGSLQDQAIQLISNELANKRIKKLINYFEAFAPQTTTDDLEVDGFI